MIRKIALLLIMAIADLSANAQRPFIDDFTIRGDTYRTKQDCFRLTEAVDYSSGSIWYKKPISLAQPFSIDLSIMVGCQDDVGADGMVFVFTSQTNRLGFVGEGIGFGGLVPSVGIEIDTWINYHLNDPKEDHLAIMANGQRRHYGNLAGPKPIPNIEDCLQHSFVVIWRPENQRLSVEIDGKEVLAAQHDLVNDIFRGNDLVYWGVTAATGRYNNIHEVCFDRMSEVPTMPTDPYKLHEPGPVWKTD